METEKRNLYYLAKELRENTSQRLGIFKVNQAEDTLTISFYDKESGDLIISNTDEEKKNSLFAIEFEDLIAPFPNYSIEDGEEMLYMICGGVLFLDY
jgi:hypothetical protein